MQLTHRRLERLERNAGRVALAAPEPVKLPDLPEPGQVIGWLYRLFQDNLLTFDINQRVTWGMAAGNAWDSYDILAAAIRRMEDKQKTILLPVLVREIDVAIAAIDAGAVQLQVQSGVHGQTVGANLTIARPPHAELVTTLHPVDRAVRVFTHRAGARWPVTLPEYRDLLEELRALALDAGNGDAAI